MRTPGAVVRDARLLVVGLHPAGADAELDAAAGEHVERGDLLRQHDRVLVVVVEDEAADAQRRGRAAAAMAAPASARAGRRSGRA